MLKLKLQYFGHLLRRADSLEKTLTLGGIGGRRKRERQRIRTSSLLRSGWQEVNIDILGIIELKWTRKGVFNSDDHYIYYCGWQPKMGGSWWRDLTKCGPLEKRMANHFSILALRTP